MEKPRIGYIGVGLMGHGAAKNILARGYPLTILAHRNRAPVEDLLRQGAKEGKSPAEIAGASDIVFLCLPSFAEVEATVHGADGILAGARAGMVLVDSTTSDPETTRRIGAELAGRGIAMVDGPLGRTPREAEAGKLSTFLGGDAAAIARVRPIIECYADTIIEAGALGAGHTLKLVNNFISIGTAALISEAVAAAAKLGVDLKSLHAVVSAGGANSRMFEMVMPWVLEGDDSRLKGPLRIAAKDIRTYLKLAERAPAAAIVASAVGQVLTLANLQGNGDRFLPVLPGIVANWNGRPIRPLS
jgi:3-hydroxyisobutyrate dehydrogenase-like beta-hydroxyacid dehydrogenase